MLQNFKALEEFVSAPERTVEPKKATNPSIEPSLTTPVNTPLIPQQKQQKATQKVKKSLELPLDLDNTLRLHAAKSRRSQSEIIIAALTAYLKNTGA
jgi:hypothetical protein